MSNQKITELAVLSDAADADVLAIVDDTAGVPVTKKITAAGLNIYFIRTAAEIAAGVTPTNFLFEPGDVRRYGSGLNAAHLQTAVDAWTAGAFETFFGAGQTFDTGSTEIVIKWAVQNITRQVFDGQGMVIAPSATIAAGNGYGLKITRAATVLVRNKVFQSFQVVPTAGDCGGIEVDGEAAGSGFLYRLTFNTVDVNAVTRHGFFLTGNFFESQFNECTVDIATNEAGFHGVFVDEDGGDSGSGDISSIELNSCVISGGENNVRLSGAGDAVNIKGGTYLLSGKEAIKSNATINLVWAVHIESCWSGASALASASWITSTSQAAINIVGRGVVRDCFFISATDTLRSFTQIFSVGEVELSGLFGISPECEFVCEAEGTAGKKITAISCEVSGVSATAVFDTNAAANVSFQAIGCPQAGDHESIKTFVSADATPSVIVGSQFFSNATGVTITRFDDGIQGQILKIISKGATVYDTSPATRLIGSTVDITTASGDITTWLCETGGTTSSVWRLTGFVDVSVDNSAGA